VIGAVEALVVGRDGEHVAPGIHGFEAIPKGMLKLVKCVQNRGNADHVMEGGSGCGVKDTGDLPYAIVLGGLEFLHQ
jgi:hypothetical protein